MPARLIDGKAIAAAIREDVRREVAQEQAARGVTPGLAVVVVGEDPASAAYVRGKARACAEAGIRSGLHALPAGVRQADLEALLRALNTDAAVHGILVQLPLPAHLDARAALDVVDPAKDVDGFTMENAGRLVEGRPVFVPCTPAGVLELLERDGVDLAGRRAVVVGRSEIVGKPLALLLLQRHATVTICHSRTRDLAAETSRAEVLIVAAGRPALVTGAMVRPGAIVIDVGINRVGGALVGDVDFASVRAVAGAVTPVPGGVGPMTVAMLLRNTLLAFRRQ